MTHPSLADQQPPALIEAVGAVPAMPYEVISGGVMSGDVSADRAILWSRTDRPARMLVDSATTASFASPTTIYADGPLSESMTLDDGSHVVKRLHECCGRYRIGLRAFHLAKDSI